MHQSEATLNRGLTTFYGGEFQQIATQIAMKIITKHQYQSTQSVIQE